MGWHIHKHTLAEIEQNFARLVPGCSHGRHCKKCCWPFRPDVDSQNYGGIYVDGCTTPAHRIAIELAHGAGILLWPRYDRIGGFVVTHKCHHKRCCNPAHLAIGTQSDNILHDPRFQKDAGEPTAAPRQ